MIIVIANNIAGLIDLVSLINVRWGITGRTFSPIPGSNSSEYLECLAFVPSERGVEFASPTMSQGSLEA